MKQIPEVKKDNKNINTLYVKGEPFIAKAGEVHNSAAESLANMETQVWPYIKELNMNTLVVPIYWDRIENEEGVYDFSLVDGLIAQAREREMHLILLWFGLWKNAESSYVPGWMKRDTQTYFRVEKVTGERLNTISPFCKAGVSKDAAAFSQVMKHIREIDEEEQTVIMMQVENEIGLLGSACDYGTVAQNEFAKPMPQELLNQYRKDSVLSDSQVSWQEVFGEDAEEAFMAWNFASAIEQIASAGKAEYNLPMYVNAWIKQHPWYAGSYPSGGPVVDMQKIWKIAASSIFTMAPDIYVPYVADIMEAYAQLEDNPLMVPEVRKDAITASYALYAFGHHHALCYSPFAIEELGMPSEMVLTPPPEIIASLKLDPDSFDLSGSKEALSGVYGLMKEMEPLYFQYRGTKHLQAYLKKSEQDKGSFLRFENYDIEVTYLPKMKGCPASSGLIYELEKNRFLIVGMMSSFRFSAKPGKNVNVEYEKMERGTIQNGEWVSWIHMNGDEKGTFICGYAPTCFMVEVFEY